MTSQVLDIVHKDRRYISISPDGVRNYAFQLGAKIASDVDNFRPTLLLALWRGGAQVGVYVQEYLKRVGIDVDHVCIRTSSYTSPGEQNSTILVHTLRYVAEEVQKGDNLLIVDDIFDSGRSLQAVIDKLRSKVGEKNMPTIRIATMFWKPEKNKTSLKPDYCIQSDGISDAWVVLPHEVSDFQDAEDIKVLFGQEVHDALYPPIMTNSAELSIDFRKKLADWDIAHAEQLKAVRAEPSLIQSSSGIKIPE